MATDFDLIVIGGGSGGLACAQRAADHGARALVIESHRLGGTCVNVGCVPKKVMWNAAQLAHAAHDAHDYGFDLTLAAPRLGAAQAQARRLHRAAQWHLCRQSRTSWRDAAARARQPDGRAHRESPRTTNTALPHIVLATGGHPVVPSIPGAAHGITSDGFFELPERPASVAIVGSGYVAVELAGVFSALGSRLSVVLRGDRLLQILRALPRRAPARDDAR